MTERFDIDVGYRDPLDRRDDFPEDKPSPAEYEDGLIDGRYQVVGGPVATWGARGWECPVCGGETNMYGHGHDGCR